MKRALLDFSRRCRPPLALSALLIACLLAGCSLLNGTSLESPEYYHPSNVSALSASLPSSLRRVALLPLTTASSVAAQEAGVDALEPVVHAELEKTQRFEVVTVSGTQLRQLTGRAAWRADESLPLDFFKRLQRETGCDAVMFCQVTHYQAYPPLSVGWKLSLAMQDAGERAQTQILWSVDEVLDAGEPHVAHAARTYYSQHVHNEQPSPDSTMILRSPTLFGQFGLSALFATLPEHGSASLLPSAGTPSPALPAQAPEAPPAPAATSRPPDEYSPLK